MKNLKLNIAGPVLNPLACILAGCLLASNGWGDPALIANRSDLVIAEFEGTNFGDWQVSGDAFGDAPAHGALPNQMPVDGFLGGGFASSYHGGEVKGELLEVTAEIALGDAVEVGFNLRGVPVTYDVQKQELSCLGRRTTLKSVAGKIELQIFVDRTAVDIFGNHGQLYMPMGIVVPPDNYSLDISAKGGAAQIESLTVYELQSAWR